MRKKICSTLLHFVSLYSILFLLLGSIINTPHDINFGSNGSFYSTLSDDEPLSRDSL